MANARIAKNDHNKHAKRYRHIQRHEELAKTEAERSNMNLDEDTQIPEPQDAVMAEHCQNRTWSVPWGSAEIRGRVEGLPGQGQPHRCRATCAPDATGAGPQI
jgi:hypothetical protein